MHVQEALLLPLQLCSLNFSTLISALHLPLYISYINALPTSDLWEGSASEELWQENERRARKMAAT